MWDKERVCAATFDPSICGSDFLYPSHLSIHMSLKLHCKYVLLCSKFLQFSGVFFRQGRFAPSNMHIHTNVEWTDYIWFLDCVLTAASARVHVHIHAHFLNIKLISCPNFSSGGWHQSPLMFVHNSATSSLFANRTFCLEHLQFFWSKYIMYNCM